MLVLQWFYSISQCIQQIRHACLHLLCFLSFGHSLFAIVWQQLPLSLQLKAASYVWRPSEWNRGLAPDTLTTITEQPCHNFVLSFSPFELPAYAWVYFYRSQLSLPSRRTTLERIYADATPNSRSDSLFREMKDNAAKRKSLLSMKLLQFWRIRTSYFVASLTSKKKKTCWRCQRNFVVFGGIPAFSPSFPLCVKGK